MFRYRIRNYFIKHNFIVPVLLLALLIALLAACRSNLISAVEGYAEIKMQALTAEVVNRAVLEELRGEGAYYTDLVSLRTGEDNGVLAVDADIVKLNILKAAVTERINEKLQTAGTYNIGVPLGTLVGGRLLMGRGPEIRIRLVPAGSARTNIASEFRAAGINQSMHRIVIDVDIDVAVIMPGGVRSCAQNTQVVMAETVIVGKVPDSYTYIEDADAETLRKLNDYKDYGLN